MALPQVDQPVGRLLHNDVVVTLERRARVGVVAEVAQLGALEVPVSATRLAALLSGKSMAFFWAEKSPEISPEKPAQSAV